jgi:hypothetical protein
MPSCRPSRLRRPVVAASTAALAVLVGLLGLLFGPAPVSDASPYSPGAGPVLTVPPEASFVMGRPGDAYLLQAVGEPVPAIGVDELPPGLRLTVHGDGSATLAGTPTGPAGTTAVQVRAQNSKGTTAEPLTVVVQQAPAFPDRGPVTFERGEFSSVVVRTVGFPAPAISVEGDLPGGLSFTDNGDGTATIAGTPLVAPAATPVTLTAVNVVADTALTTSIEVVVRPEVSAEPTPKIRLASPRREP